MKVLSYEIQVFSYRFLLINIISFFSKKKKRVTEETQRDVKEITLVED